MPESNSTHVQFFSPDRVARFWSRVDCTPDGCWLWPGATSSGYGQVKVGGRVVYAHVFAFETEHGQPVPDGHEIDHTCRVPLCVRPSHLESVTPAENLARRVYPDPETREECANGHPWGDVYVTPTGGYHCRPCRRAAQARAYARRTSA